MAVENTPAPVVVDLSVAEFRARLDEALGIYVAAMDYPRGTEHHRAPMWSEHVTRPGWRGVAATVPGTTGEADRLVGIAYGYRGAPHQWWHQQVYSGMRRSGWSDNDARSVLDNYVELTELHVHPSAQGHRLGEALLWRFLDDRPESTALLSTPEIDGEDNRAWRLYRRLGFRDIIRNFTFTGDSRPFAVLGRALPLTGPPA
ncbi:GNAT family N-acetyltransferase [Antrihabitans cavernicola]|uniref:GNAT family N-acetyltransferase n=1 Tax=Antrihabitans cavernicola TaxID=2495913 RepID=A0A5A7SD72_9NOCA|nr:GNAT family N-acetyltransferase [Spelaeibacter cavernicola]KAA0023132.1 GNAT family N-acetyltransferase [Spelaeibacter cavernicola]